MVNLTRRKHMGDREMPEKMKSWENTGKVGMNQWP